MLKKDLQIVCLVSVFLMAQRENQFSILVLLGKKIKIIIHIISFILVNYYSN